MNGYEYTALLLIIDRSGSMQSIKKNVVEGLNNLLEKQQQLSGFLTVDVFQFDTEIKHAYKMQPAKNVAIKLKPRGKTALYDAIGTAVTSMQKQIDNLPAHAKPTNVQVVVVTDGIENASTFWTKRDVRDLVTSTTGESNWNFLFMGANQDAILNGGELGFKKENSLTYRADAEGVKNMTDALSKHLTSSRVGASTGFSDMERASASPLTS